MRKSQIRPAGRPKHRKLRGQALQTRRRRRPGGGRAATLPATSWFDRMPRLLAPGRAFGVAILVGVAERAGEQATVQHALVEEVFARPGMRPKARILDRVQPEALAQLSSGLAHADRIRIAKAILAGAGSHRELSKAVALQTGPLYHHLRELERAGIVGKASRNLYVLTDTGRLVLFVTTMLAQHGADSRRSWQSTEVACQPRGQRRRAGGRRLGARRQSRARAATRHAAKRRKTPGL